MSAEGSERVRLHVRAEDPTTELFLIDNRFQVAARGVGTLDEAVPPGIYKIKARAGPYTREEPLLLTPSAGSVRRLVHTPAIPSPVPLVGTSKTHEYHMEAAVRESRRTHVQAGSGSSIFVFVREWSGSESGGPALKLHPARGLTLRTIGDVPLVDFAERGRASLDADPWAACNVAVDPGLYRLCLELPSGSRIEQTVVAVAGWQTQIFLLQRSYGDDPDYRRADLVSTSVKLTQGGFDPDRSERLVELARLGLTDRRRVLSDDVRAMLQGKFHDPMLGIFGAHLLLLDDEPDLGLLDIVVSNLRGMLGPHPDVEALALRLGPDATSYVFAAPPMLRRSWLLVVEATVRQPSLVPPDSLAAMKAACIVPAAPWCLWLTLSPGGEEEEEEDATLAATVSTMLGHAAPADLGALGEAAESGASPRLDDETARHLVQTLGVPRATIEGIIERGLK